MSGKSGHTELSLITFALLEFYIPVTAFLPVFSRSYRLLVS